MSPHQILDLLAHLATLVAVGDLVQAVDHQQTPAAHQDPVEEILRQLQDRAAPAQIPGEIAGQGSHARIVKLASCGMAALVQIVTIIAQGNQNGNQRPVVRQAIGQCIAGLSGARQRRRQVSQYRALTAAGAAHNGQAVRERQQIGQIHAASGSFLGLAQPAPGQQRVDAGLASQCLLLSRRPGGLKRRKVSGMKTSVRR